VRSQGHRAVLADVARMAGVSRSTASKILNEVPTLLVRPDTRQRVLDAAAALDYRPHATARALAGGSPHALALLVPELTNPVYSKMIRSAFSQAHALGYTVMVAEDLQGQDVDQSFGNLVAAGHVDGLLISSARAGNPMLNDLARRGIPHVFMNRPLSGSGRNVTMDIAGASDLAVQHLVALGHQVIGHVAGPRGLETGHTRAEAFLTATQRLGVPQAPISHAPFDEEGGATATLNLLDGHPGLTAIYSSSLSQAVGVLHAIHGRGLRIPDDVSVVAYDDLPLANYLWPPLDTIAMPLAELGRTAVSALVDQIDGAPPKDIRLPVAPRLELRGSSAAPA
jgi:DNA-binding LacI/PurR family transcriptional regulator